MVHFDLALLCNDLRLTALDLSTQAPDAELVGAQLVDGFRDLAIPAPTLVDWQAQIGGFDAAAIARMQLLVRVFRESPSAAPVRKLLQQQPAAALEAFTGFSIQEAQLLTLELLLKSPFRVEELARKWIGRLGGEVTGESQAESALKLERLDYGGVLKNLKAADADRASRMKKLQEAIDKKREADAAEAARAGRE